MAPMASTCSKAGGRRHCAVSSQPSQATAMNNVFRNVGGSIGAPIAGSLLATFVITTGPWAGSGLPTHLAFQYAFWIAAGIILLSGVAVLFGQEVLGPARHAKFAHLPTLPRRLGNAQGGASTDRPSPEAGPSPPLS